MKTTGMTIWTFVNTLYLLVLNKLEYVEEIQLDFKEIFSKYTWILRVWFLKVGSLWMAPSDRPNVFITAEGWFSLHSPLLVLFSFLFFSFHWSIVALQCASFYCTAKCILCICTCIPLFLDFLPICHCCCSVTQLCLTLWDPIDCSIYARLPCPSLSSRVCSNSRPLHQWWHVAISSSDTLFSFCP